VLKNVKLFGPFCILFHDLGLLFRSHLQHCVYGWITGHNSQPTADGKNCKMSTLSPTKHYTQTNVKTSKSYNNVQKLEGQPLLISDPNYHQGTPNQGRNHVYRVGSPLSWSGVLLPFSRNFFLERYTQFGAVCYPHQTPTKRLCKKLGVRPNSGGVRTSRPPSGCVHAPSGWWLKPWNVSVSFTEIQKSEAACT